MKFLVLATLFLSFLSFGEEIDYKTLSLCYKEEMTTCLEILAECSAYSRSEKTEERKYKLFSYCLIDYVDCVNIAKKHCEEVEDAKG